MSDKVAVVECASYDASAVKKAIEKLLEPFSPLPFLKPGVKIVIKANLVTMMKPESAATVHPALLKELCAYLVNRGADVVVGDSPGGLFTSAYVNAVYSVTGIKCVEEAGAKLNQNFSHTHSDNPGGAVLKELDYTSYLDDADVIINFCKLKTHGMMGMSACVKNMFGCVPGTFKPEYHYKYPNHEQFAVMLVDLNERFKPALCVVDAVMGMEGNGPTMGKPRKIGCLLASDTPYACDRVCAGIIGIDADGLETVSAAKARGLENDYEVIGNPEEFKIGDFDLVRTRKDMSFNHELPGAGGKLLGHIIRKALCSVPDVKKGQCVGCAKCQSVCPAKAITMIKARPMIDRDKCIRCFCCQEFCPKGAMKVKRPLAARILNR